MSEPAIKTPEVSRAIQAHATFRDHIFEALHGDHMVEEGAFASVALKLFGYCFNTYKAIGLLMPERYYEQGMSLHRTLWETSANFAWIAQDSEARSHEFLGFTAVEYRRFLQSRVDLLKRAGDPDLATKANEELHKYEQVLNEQLGRFRHTDRRGRKKLRDRFSGPSLETVIRDLGPPWSVEYLTHYRLGSAYTHGAPAGVLFPHFYLPDKPEEAFARVDDDRTTLLALFSMEIMRRTFIQFSGLIGRADDGFYEKLKGELMGGSVSSRGHR